MDEQASLLHRTGEWISSAVVSVNKDAGACSWNGIGLTELPQGINRAEGIIFLGVQCLGRVVCYGRIRTKEETTEIKQIHYQRNNSALLYLHFLYPNRSNSYLSSNEWVLFPNSPRVSIPVSTPEERQLHWFWN